MLKTAALVLALVAAPAAAADTRTVPYHDIDLASNAGHRQLERRIAQAAKAVCSDGNARRSIAETAERARCIAAAKAGAMAEVARLDTRELRGG